LKNQQISFGDNVRVRNSVETQAAEVAGLIGQVYGETTPSVTGVEVIGDVTRDYAINVFFEEQDESLWFSPDLLELVDHGAGTEITLDGVDKKWTRTESGEWIESPGDEQYRSFWERVIGLVLKRKE
jgi:hypothetical protein